MRDGRPSGSAETVALIRAHLHWADAVDDPFAARFLGPRRRLLAAALRRPPLRAFGRSPTFAFLAARTHWFDDMVEGALDEGIDQVVLVGAGYDARAWRLARPGVRWFEVDHPATQHRKRELAPSGDVTWVALDLRHAAVEEVLPAAGLDRDRPAVFVLEGLTMYLRPDDCERLFSALGALAARRSVLAVQFSARGGGSTSPVSRAVATVIRTTWAWSGEPTYRWADERRTGEMLERTGWRTEATTAGNELARRYLEGTGLRAAGVNNRVYCTRARRPGATSP